MLCATQPIRAHQFENQFKEQFNAGQTCIACGDGCVNAACLPQDAETGGKACWIAGWGTTEENGSTPATLSSGKFEYFYEVVAVPPWYR